MGEVERYIFFRNILQSNPAFNGAKVDMWHVHVDVFWAAARAYRHIFSVQCPCAWHTYYVDATTLCDNMVVSCRCHCTAFMWRYTQLWKFLSNKLLSKCSVSASLRLPGTAWTEGDGNGSFKACAPAT